MIYVQRNQFLPGKVMMRLITYFRGSQTGPRDHLHKNYLGGAWKKQISQLWNRDGSHLQSLWFLMNCKIWEPLDSSPFYTSTVNTSVTHQFKNNHAKKKKKINGICHRFWLSSPTTTILKSSRLWMLLLHIWLHPHKRPDPKEPSLWVSAVSIESSVYIMISGWYPSRITHTQGVGGTFWGKQLAFQ